MVLDEQQRFNRRPDPSGESAPRASLRVSRAARRILAAYVAVFVVALLVRGLYLYDLQGEAVFASVPAGAKTGPFPASIDRLRIVFAVLGSIACVWTTAAGRRFFDLQTGLVAGWMLAIYPPAMFFESRLQETSWILALTAAFLAVLGFLALRPVRRVFPFAGVVVGLMALSTAKAWALAVIVTIWCLAAPKGAQRKRAVRAALFAFGFVAFVGVAILLGIPPQMPSAPSFDGNLLEAGATLLNAREIGDSVGIEAFRGRSKILQGLVWWHFGVLMPLAFLGFWTTRRRWRWLGVVHGIVLIFTLGVLFPPASGASAALRLPLLPALTLFAAAGLLDLLSLIRQRRTEHPLTPLVVIAAALMLCNWPIKPPIAPESPHAESWYRLGVELLEQGDAPRALEALEESLRFAESGLSQSLLGEIYLADEEYEEALGRFRRAAEMLPENTDVQRNLAFVATTTGREEEAVRAWEAVLSEFPDDLDAHVQLGYFAVLSGDRERAERHLRAARRIDPEHEGVREMLERIGR